MLDNMITVFSEGIVGWGVLGVLGIIAAVFVVYYISFAIYLIVASIYSGIKMLPQSYRIWREDLAADYQPGWDNAQLGMTMPDGGEPVKKEEEEKEKAKQE